MPEPRTTLDLLLGLLADTDGAPTPAQVRAALRHTDLQDLSNLAGAARALISALETIETTAGTLARTHGADDVAVCLATGLTLRTLQRRYPKKQLKIIRPEQGLLALVDVDEQGRPRPLFVELDLPQGELRLSTEPVEAAEVEAGRILRWPLPLTNGAGGTTALETLAPRAQRILIGADPHPGPGIERRTLDQDAREAAHEISYWCVTAAERLPRLRVQDAAEYYADQDPHTVATRLGLPTGADQTQITVAAQVARDNALTDLVILTSAEAYLTRALVHDQHGPDHGETVPHNDI